MTVTPFCENELGGHLLAGGAAPFSGVPFMDALCMCASALGGGMSELVIGMRSELVIGMRHTSS